MKFCLFFLCCWCLNVEWRSSWVSYCPENHEIFQAADMACQDFESLHWKSLYPGRMNYLREYQDCYLLCWKVSKSWDSEFDFSPVFTFILKYEIIQSLTNIQISYWNNSNIYIYIYIYITNHLLQQHFCNWDRQIFPNDDNSKPLPTDIS